MNSKTSLLLEYTWLIIAVGSLIAAIHQWYKSDLDNSLPIFAMVLISMIMFSIRRRLRKKQNTESNN